MTNSFIGAFTDTDSLIGHLDVWKLDGVENIASAKGGALKQKFTGVAE